MDHFAGLDVSVKETSVCIWRAIKIKYLVHAAADPEKFRVTPRVTADLSRNRSAITRSSSRRNRLVRGSGGPQNLSQRCEAAESATHEAWAL